MTFKKTLSRDWWVWFHKKLRILLVLLMTGSPICYSWKSNLLIRKKIEVLKNDGWISHQWVHQDGYLYFHSNKRSSLSYHSTDWYLTDNSWIFKSFIHQTMSEIIKFDSSNGIKTNLLAYSQSYLTSLAFNLPPKNFGFGLLHWRQIYKIISHVSSIIYEMIIAQIQYKALPSTQTLGMRWLDVWTKMHTFYSVFVKMMSFIFLYCAYVDVNLPPVC